MTRGRRVSGSVSAAEKFQSDHFMIRFVVGRTNPISPDVKYWRGAVLIGVALADMTQLFSSYGLLVPKNC